MANTEDDADSRTALINAPRSRSYPNSARDSGDNEDRPAKRRRRNRSRANSDVTDFVPVAVRLVLILSRSGSSSSDESDSDAEMGKRQVVANPHAGSAPVINWNSGRKAAVRTTLGKRKTPAGRQSGPKEPQEKERPDKKAKQDESQFKDVNTFWRAGSASASDEASDIVNGKEDSDSRSEGEVSDDESINIESDSSGSLDSEEDDSMLLNIGTKDGAGSDDYDPAEMEVGNGTVNGANGQTPETASSATSNPRRSQSKEAAFQQFAKKYPTAPVTLADLDEEELQIQVQYIYWDRDSDGIDMQLPVGCTECLQHGHLTDVCPAREVRGLTRKSRRVGLMN
ncbi:hypothetical protein N7470_000343 [Penicillium chermesinum]|nr:hypothetical protein N7470_000343 [Penicillium chermesinum]